MRSGLHSAGASPEATIEDVTGALGGALGEFTRVRPRLFGIAYRMLGSVAEAEDVLQEVWVRWQSVDHGGVRDPAAFLATATTRLSINVAQSARARRETYVGPWLPEPVDTSTDPALGAERNEALEVAVLLVLERLTPTERAAYVLREAFEYPYDQLADVLGLTPPNVRQLVRRARKHLAEERRVTVSVDEQRRLLEAFISAARAGDVGALEQMLAADVVSYSDGGGRVRAARIPVLGRLRVAKFIHAFASHFWTDVAVATVTTNGAVASLLSKDGAALAVVSITPGGDGIRQIQWQMNPDKLSAIPEAGPARTQVSQPRGAPGQYW